ncbi:hypothetical protein OIN59_12070 [Acidovorax sp. D2M1]|uniref:Zinc dependent phospholipase C n=1 Tax=Acidovorax benzenivorans TaxID=2987520 RepID=A0ABT5RWV3_9BURK|nr:hypothetical protein [Acidovorax benzenivorans]MDD2178172.1 hypothetical protein [Acidovorax benzenivorans]
MPKFGTHILIAEIAAKRRPELFESPDVGNSFRLGAVGPDLTLFLFDPFFTDRGVKDGFNEAIHVFSEIRSIKKTLNELADDLSKPIDDAADWVTGGLYPAIKSVTETAIEAAILALKLGLATSASPINIKNPLAELYAKGLINPALLLDPKYLSKDFLVEATDNSGFPFRHFGHPFTDDSPWSGNPADNVASYSKWWWMDLLHYRHTGTFAKNMLGAAKDPLTRAYAKGYLSHVAGDICGHPFVNSLVDGPFRNHAYRHLVLEGLADTWLWDQQGRGDIVVSKLHDRLALSPSDLDKVSGFLIDALRKTYRPPMVPNQIPGNGGYPSKFDLRAAYEAMQLYLDMSTSDGLVRPTPPPDDPGELLDELQTLLSRNTPSNPPSFNPNNPIDYLAALIGWFLKGVVYIAMLATLPVAVMARLVNLAPRWALYVIEMAIYFIVSAIRLMLALMGYGYASRDDFSNFGFIESLIRTKNTDVYPMKSTPKPKPPYYWLVTPRKLGAPREPNSTFVGPIPSGSTPYWMIDSQNTMHPDLFFLQELMSAPTPKDTESILAYLQRKNGFGNAVDFYLALLEERLPIPDLDLDGDRGYASRPWTELPPNERYV